jgi:hypothetical protein
MKAHGIEEAQIHSFLTWLNGKIHKPAAFTPDTIAAIPLRETQDWSRRFENRENSYTVAGSRTAITANYLVN